MGVDSFRSGTVGDGTVIIDLGLERGEPDTYAAPARSTVPSWFGPLMIALLVLICSVASAAPPPPALSPMFSLQVGPADSFLLTDDSALLAQTVGTISAYDLTDGALRWQTDWDRLTYRLRTSDGLVLVRPWTYGPARASTTALSLTTGVLQWRHDGTVITIPGSSALLAVSAVRSGGTGRRVQGPVESINPRTGAVRWRVGVPSTAVLLGLPGPDNPPPRMMLLHDDRTAAVHDLATGERIAVAEMPAANYGPENPTVSGGLILLRHLGHYGAVVSAYDPVTLHRVWQRPAGRAYEVRACGPLACFTGPDGVRGVDPATGDLRWIQPTWRSVEQRGRLMLAYASPSGVLDPVGLIDPQTGRIVVDLHGWRMVGGDGGDHVLVTKAVEAGARTMVAIAEPGSPGPWPLADLPAGAGDCQAVPNRLVCRSTSGDLMVWAYRKKI